MDSANEWLRRNYALEGLKKLLGVRYFARLIHKDDLIKETNSRIRIILAKLSVEELTMSSYILYTIFYLFPWTYHLLRIIKDPSMIKVEKNLKSKKEALFK